MRKLFKWKFLSCVLLCLAVGLLPMVQAEAVVVYDPILDEDTKGDWLNGSALNGRVYGDCFYLLPDPCCKGFPEPLFGTLKGGVCTSGLSYFVSGFDLRRGDDQPARTFWNTLIDCTSTGAGDLCGTVDEQSSNCDTNFSSCPGSAQWNPCADAFKSTLWDEGDCITPGGIEPPLIAELTLNFNGSTELAYYFVATCNTSRTQSWRLYINDNPVPVQSDEDSGSKKIIVTGDGKYLYFQLDNVVPGTKIRFETENVSNGLCENSVLSGVFLSDCLECDIKVTKTCAILPPPPGPEVSTCDDLKDVTGLTMIWRGQNNVNIETETGQKLNGIQKGQIVFLDTPKDETGNDVDVTISDALGDTVGMSKFHISCSDPDMNGFEDCGKDQGDGKSNDSNLINLWEFGGMTGEKGQFTCDNAQPDLNGFPTETEECEFTPQPDGGNCDDIKDVTGLTMIWNGLSGLNIETETGQVIEGIKNGDIVFLDTPKDDTGNDVEVFLSGSVEGKSKFHISCSDDDMDGPEDCGEPQGNGKDNDDRLNNEWLFGGMTGEKGSFGCPGVPGGSDSAEVVYGIRVDNPSNEPVVVQIEDAELGINQTETIQGYSTFDLVTDPITIMPDDTNEFTNTVVVTAETLSGATCVASDSVTVKRNPPPPPPVSCSDIKDITAVSVVWTGDEPVNVVMESGEMFENVMTGNKITFQEANTGNDVEMSIFKAGTSTLLGKSKFHVSCSDEDMNGSEDCGNAQGDGKDDDDRLNNGWLLDGMTGENGSFDCNLPNTGVVAPSGGTGVTGAATLDLRDDKKVKWELTNNGNQDVFITRVEVTWPDQHGQVKKFKLEGDFAKDVFDDTSPTVVPDEKDFERNPNKRKLKKDDHKKLEIEFTEKFKDHVEGDFTLSVEFDTGEILTFP